MRTRTVLISLGLVVMLIGGCLGLLLVANFQYTSSGTEASTTTASSRWPEGSTMAAQAIHFQVEGDGRLAEALAAALADEIPGAALAEEGSAPEMIVTLAEVETRWTPIYGRSSVVARAAISSNGDFAFRESAPTHFESTHDGSSAPVVQALSTIELTDRSRGLFSRPGYTRLVATRLAEEIKQMLETQVFAAP